MRGKQVSKMEQLILDGVEYNKQDGLARYVFYIDGGWKLGLRLPTLVDFATIYVIEHGVSHAVCF